MTKCIVKWARKIPDGVIVFVDGENISFPYLFVMAKKIIKSKI